MTTSSPTKQPGTLGRVLLQSEIYLSLRNAVADGQSLSVAGLAGSANALLISSLFSELQRTMVVVAPLEKVASALAADLSDMCGEEAVAPFPAWGTYPYDWLMPPLESVSQRIETLWQIMQEKPVIVVTTPVAISEPTLTQEALIESCFNLSVGEEFDMQEIADRLVRLGYEREPITEEVGTFSIRGGILDIFPFTSTNPIRCEFFGDTIDSMREFSVLSQRSVSDIGEIAIIPRREIMISPAELEERIEKLRGSSAEILAERCLSGFDNPGLEWVAPMLGLKQSYLTDHLPEDYLLYLTDRSVAEERLMRAEQDALESYEQLRPELADAPTPETIYLTGSKLFAAFDKQQCITELPLGRSADAIDFGMKDHPAFNGQIKLLRERLKQWSEQQEQVLLVCDTELQARRLRDLLGEQGESVSFVISSLQQGFILPETNSVVLTDHQIFERQIIRQRKRVFKEGQAISSYAALELGDYVVHVDHGIGRYRGLQEISINRRKRECLLIYYADDDKLYVPIEEFGRVQKYVGKDGTPRLTKLGGKSWEKVKARTKKAIADMADELIRLYAARKARPGHAFGDDDEMMRQLEASFPYQETPDQLTSIKAVKEDMLSNSPMDRLICGDVGFGKTEVAVRAALRAVSDGMQVAVLVPTTILAQQHLNTFRKRLGAFPIRVEALSRFLSRQEQKQIVADVEARKVDVIIGTHRLLQKDLKIPNLGLIIVDEEQRFGVAHKERLKGLKQLADCLTLTATPIPRTLQMSLLGARDMSVINTSPKDRQPIITEIAEFDPRIIYDAITAEVERGGQVYFVHNRVETIESMHHYLTKLLKTIRVTVAHGQMPEKELEQVMLSFMEKEYDVLLCSAIIESGIDIPSVNTIIINRADRFGLAQLYQLRGRVGRSQQRAYAYMLIPPVRKITDTARKRLKAIEQHTELGSGFHLAMRDLEIRGAGNLLGPQQHGFIEEVGFDLYCRLLEEAVAEIKGEVLASDFDVKLEIDRDCYLPDDYIEDSKQRVEIYRKIADAKDSETLAEIAEELRDRFGRFGEETENLLDMMEINLLARERKIARVRLSGDSAMLVYDASELPGKSQIEALRRAWPENLGFNAAEGFVINIGFSDTTERPLSELKKLLKLL